MKKIFLLAGLFLATIAQAQDRIVLEMNDGTKSEWLIDDAPFITTQGDKFVVICNEEVEAFPISDVRKVYSTETPTSNIFPTMNSTALVSVADRNIEVMNVAGSVSLVNMLGVCIRQCMATNGTAQFSNVPTGIYLVKTDGESTKVVVK